MGNPQESDGILRNPAVPCGILTDPFGILGGFQESPHTHKSVGILWNPQKSPGVPGNPLSIMPDISRETR
eukprot:1656600-Pyramimonas_sp.AAC.1